MNLTDRISGKRKKSRRAAAVRCSVLALVLVTTVVALISTQETDAVSLLLHHELKSRTESQSTPSRTSSSTSSPLDGMIRSFTPHPDRHDPQEKRTCFSFTAVPLEMFTLYKTVKTVLRAYNSSVINCIHLSIPDQSARFKLDYPDTSSLLAVLSDPRVILHRLSDYGPLTRYIGPLAYEKNPDTIIAIFDMDSQPLATGERSLIPLLQAANRVDRNAMWCYQGEDFLFNQYGQTKPTWDIPKYPKQWSPHGWYNQVFFCRGVGGLLFKPKFFGNFWWNHTGYDKSCYWDDDRWVSFQMERQRIPMLALEPPTSDKSSRRLGSLTQLTSRLQSHQKCTLAWMLGNPEAYPLARTTVPEPWKGINNRPPIVEVLLEEVEKVKKRLAGAASKEVLAWEKAAVP